MTDPYANAPTDEERRARWFLSDVLDLLDEHTVPADLLPSEQNRVRRAKEFRDGIR